MTNTLCRSSIQIHFQELLNNTVYKKVSNSPSKSIDSKKKKCSQTSPFTYCVESRSQSNHNLGVILLVDKVIIEWGLLRQICIRKIRKFNVIVVLSLVVVSSTSFIIRVQTLVQMYVTIIKTSKNLNTDKNVLLLKTVKHVKEICKI